MLMIARFSYWPYSAEALGAAAEVAAAPVCGVKEKKEKGAKRENGKVFFCIQRARWER